MRDAARIRGYRALKLASWLLDGVYWTDLLTQRQVEYLVNRALNHPEIRNRWELNEVDILFPTRGLVAWARLLPGQRGRGEITLPPGTLNPLIVLHEVAHLLTPTRREPHHGPGFNAVFLMLVDLLMPAPSAQVLAAAFDATNAPVDPTRIPASTEPSSYVPVIGADADATVKHLGALLATGAIPAKQETQMRAAMQRLARKARREPSKRLRQLPTSVTIPTRELLRASTPDDIAQLVAKTLREEMFPHAMLPPPKQNRKPPTHSTRKTRQRRSTRR